MIWQIYFSRVHHLSRAHHPDTNFTKIQIAFSIMRGTLKYCVAQIRPISCPLKDFVLPPENSEKFNPRGARKRSSFRIASALARSRQPSSSVHRPIYLGYLKHTSEGFDSRDSFVLEVFLSALCCVLIIEDKGLCQECCKEGLRA